MIHLKLFEGYFNKSEEVLFEILSPEEHDKFKDVRNLDVISNNELSEITDIFGLDFKLNSEGKTAFTPTFSIDLTDTQKFFPRVVAKYDDDWWILIIYDYKTKGNHKVLCDGIDGIEAYAKSISL